MKQTSSTSIIGYWHEFKRMSIPEKSLVFLFLILLVPQLFMYVYGITNRIGLGEINEFLKPSLIVILLIIGFSQFYKKLILTDVLFVIIVGLYCFLSPIIYPKTTKIVNELGPQFVFFTLPFFLLGITIDFKKHANTFIQVGRIGVILSVLLIMLGNTGSFSFNFSDEDEYMGQAYQLLMPSMFVIWSETKKHNLLDMILTLFAFISMIGLGTRGPVVSMAFFLIVSLFINLKKLVYRIALILMGLVILYLFEPILLFVGSIMSSLGMSSRVIDSMVTNELLSTSNRDWIFERITSEISHQDAFGSGLFFDRIILGDVYAHNFFYEIYINFGVYIGTVLLLLLFFIIIRDMFKLRGTEYLTLLLAFFCIGFVPLMFSDSYLQCEPFWMLLGVLVCLYRTPKWYYHN